MMSEYSAELLAHWKREERLVPDYMQNHSPRLNAKMRSILLDWLVEVCSKFKLNDETLFLTAFLIDSFIAERGILRKRFQLVGVVSLLIAAKYEAQYPPNVRDAVYICDSCYEAAEVAHMEALMLDAVREKLRSPTVMHFLPSFTRYNGSNWSQRQCSLYLMELAMVHSSMFCCKYKPSHLAAASVLASNLLAVGAQAWPPNMHIRTGYSKSELWACALSLIILCRDSFNDELQGVRSTFTHRLGLKPKVVS